MNICYFKRIKGLIRRWYRKNFHKNWEVVEHGLYFFQEFADIYGETINDIETAERFFKDFVEQTKGWVIVDFLDTDNWDCIRKVEVDKQNGLIWFYWQIPSGDPFEEEIRKMVFPLGYYGMCLKFDNLRFLIGKRNKCLGIVVNGYTIQNKDVEKFAKHGNWKVKATDAKSSFFSTSLVRERNGVFQHWRFMNTPISSFWIIPKRLNIHPQDSEKLLYMYGVEKCENNLKIAYNNAKKLNKASTEEQRKKIKASAHDMRTVAESLFKLIVCFYQKELPQKGYNYKVRDYNLLMLGNLAEPLKNTIFIQDIERSRINEITTIANDLSHDSGNPVRFEDLTTLFDDITYFIEDFESRIMRKGHEVIVKHSDKPSPHDFVKANYKSFCFIDEINEIVRKTNGKISFKIKTQIGTFVAMNLFWENGEEVLCSDGYIRNSKETDVDILNVWDRTEVIELLNKMYQKVIATCNANGYDTETYSLGISFEAKLKKEGTPSHLFTESEIEDLMRNADDGNNNQLVIDEDGYAHIIQGFKQGNLYPVSQETWCAGNMYVGKDSNLSDLHDSYVLCMHLWLSYLKTGRHMYDDCYVSDNGLDKVIEAVKQFYSDYNK